MTACICFVILYERSNLPWLALNKIAVFYTIQGNITFKSYVGFLMIAEKNNFNELYNRKITLNDESWNFISFI